MSVMKSIELHIKSIKVYGFCLNFNIVSDNPPGCLYSVSLDHFELLNEKSGVSNTASCNLICLDIKSFQYNFSCD